MGIEISAKNKNEIILYQPDNVIQLEVRVENETVWLTQDQIALLFGIQRPAITKHLGNIFKSGELDEKEVCSILELTTIHGAIAGKTQIQQVKIYNLDAILSVGYRVNSINLLDNEIYHIGASLKDLGKKLFAFNKMEMSAEELLKNI